MKNYLFIAATLLLFSACKQGELDQANSDKGMLLSAKDSLLAVLQERDSSMTDLLTTINEVEGTLDSVAVRQQIVTVSSNTPGELNKASQKSRINSQINAINALMEQNRKKVADLNRRQRNSAHKNAELEKTILNLNNQLAQKESELKELNEKLNNLNAQVAQLTTNLNNMAAESMAKSKVIEEETSSLHTAYYVMGKSKALKEANIIDKKGGLLGLGKTSKLNSEIDNNKFTRIDYTQTTNIPVNSKMKIVTSHPATSYKLQSDTKDKDLITAILITNPEKFWSASKYLVVVKN